jgi:hypothetical protein
LTRPFCRSRVADYALLVVAILLSLVLPWYPAVTSQSTPPVDVLYSESGLTYENGLYYDKIVLRNHGSETITVVAVIKTEFDYSPRRSSPTTICSGCTVTVLIKEIQPLATQTPEQRQYMIEGMTHPDYIRVEYAGASFMPLNNTLGYEVAVAGIVALIAFLYYLAKRRKSGMVRSGSGYVDRDWYERMREDARINAVTPAPTESFTNGSRTLTQENNEELRTVMITSTTKFCRYCGAKILRDSKFCKECGKSLAGRVIENER